MSFVAVKADYMPCAFERLESASAGEHVERAGETSGSVTIDRHETPLSGECAAVALRSCLQTINAGADKPRMSQRVLWSAAIGHTSRATRSRMVAKLLGVPNAMWQRAVNAGTSGPSVGNGSERVVTARVERARGRLSQDAQALDELDF